MDNRLIPECYADTALIAILGYKNSNHQLGIGGVINVLKKLGYNNQIGIGIIDRDKKMPSDVNNQYKKILTKGSIEIRQMPNTKKFLIIHPNFETWTWDEGQRLNILYSEKADRKSYKDVCKDKNALKDNKLKNYLNKLKQANSEIQELDIIIKDLIKNNP